MSAFIDLTGQKFHRLTVLSREKNNKQKGSMWLCKCDCGTVKIISGRSLRENKVYSCGCYHKDDLRKRLTTHGMTHTRIRNIWNCMKQRCNNQNDTAYKYYGGRGISVCDEWNNNFVSFYQWSMDNGYSDNLTIDRIDTNKNYSPDNCRWVTQKKQMNNTRRCHKFTINGETKTLAEWCRIFNVPHERTRNRVVNKGWDILDALTTPSLKKSS